MIQYEQFSDKAKQVIELFKDFRKDKDANTNLNLIEKIHFNTWISWDNSKTKHILPEEWLISYACMLYRMEKQEISEILSFARSKDFWRKKTKIKMNNGLLSKDQMKKLSTKRLLAYKVKLMSYHETPDWDDPNSICKASNVWKEAYTNLKAVLATKENLKK